MMLLVGLFASCSKDGTEENSDNPVQPGPSGKYYCTTDMPDDWVLGWSDSWVSFPLITNIAEFKVTVSESWLTAEVQPTADAGKKELMVRVEKYDLRDASGNNIFAEPRIAKVHITGGGVFDRSVSIVQNSHVQITLPSLPYVDANQVLYLTADGETLAAHEAEAAAPAKAAPAKAKASGAKAKAAPAAPSPKAVPQKGLSLLNAAAAVLERSDAPMAVRGMIEEAKAQGLWTPRGGKTPEQTLYSAIIREIRDRGGESRFRKDGRGLFAFAK